MRGIINKNFKKYYLAILFAAVLVLLPTHPAKACIFSLSPISNCILEGTSYIVYLIFTIVGNGIAALASVLQWVINIPVYPSGGIAVIDESWKIMRNFANMFFIVALIMMAFATIFDVLPGAAKYNARTLFGRFLFTALLINFSLVLGVMVIQGAQVLSNTFLTSIGNMSGRLGQSLNPSLLIPNVDSTTISQAVDQGIFGALTSLIFALVLAITFLFSILTAVIFAIIRIPILWALLVVSPIAWILNIFPAGEGMFKKWWSIFVGWNMFLPIFLFFLYFGLYFLSNQGAVMAAIANQVKNQPLGEGIPFTFQTLFMYIMAGIFLIGGTIVAMKASMFSGTGVVSVAGWAKRAVANRMGLTAAGQAAKGRYEEYKEGQEGAVQRQAALFRTGLGRITGGRTDAQDRQLAADVKKSKEKFESITDPAQLTALMSKGRRDERLAAAEIMKDRGLLNNAQLQKTYALYGANTLAGKQFARSLNYDKMTADERKGWLGTVPDVETMQKILNAMADKGDDYIKNEQNLNRALELFKLEGDQRDLLKKIEKHELTIATKIQMDRGFLKDDQGVISNDIDRAMKVVIGRMNPDALLEATRTITTNPQLSAVAKDSLNQQKITAMMAKGTEAQLNAWKKIDDRFDAEKIKAETEEAEKRKAQYLADALKKAGIGGPGGGGENPPAINPNNVIDLRNQTGGTRPLQNPIEYLKANLEFFDRSSKLKAAEESLSKGLIDQQTYEDEKRKYKEIQNKVSDLDLRGGLPNNFKNLRTVQDFERKLKELQP